MQKIAFILLLSYYLTACSVSKPVIRNSAVRKNTEGNIVDLTGLRYHNITSSSFHIQKAEVEITDQGEKQRFFASVKFNKPDSFLISVRSTTGIEAVRIFTTKDTILINDRLSKIFYYGTQEAARKKYGLSSILFPVLLGDIIASDKSDNTEYKCENGVIRMDSFVDEYRVSYLVNCEDLKTTEITLKRVIDTKTILFRYSDFERVSAINFAGRLSITNLNNTDLIDVKFSRIQVPWDGDMIFIPGSNYERIEIK